MYFLFICFGLCLTVRLKMLLYMVPVIGQPSNRLITNKVKEVNISKKHVIKLYIQTWSELLAPLVNMIKKAVKMNLHCKSF